MDLKPGNIERYRMVGAVRNLFLLATNAVPPCHRTDARCSVSVLTAWLWQMTVVVAVFVMQVDRQVESVEAAGSDSHSLNAIFAEQQVEGVALDVHRQAMKLPADARYEFLSDWVLPGANHESLRMNIGFTQTNPCPISADYLSVDSDKNETRTRRPSGGELVSPAWDLVNAAKLTGRLSELR
jgi:hypothetical protein